MTLHRVQRLHLVPIFIQWTLSRGCGVACECALPQTRICDAWMWMSSINNRQLEEVVGEEVKKRECDF